MTERPTASDHAVCRYLERVFGVDVEGLRRRIARAAALAHVHDAEAVCAGRWRYVVREGVVVTIEWRNGTKRGRVRRRRRGA